MKRELISVVVIGRNEGARLERCLASIQNADWSNFDHELIYVDSGSRDDSAGVAHSFGARCLLLDPTFPTAALARNAGWREARGSFVFFLDGDTLLHPRFVELAMPSFAAKNIGVVWGHRREIGAKNSIYNRVLDLDWIYPPGRSDFCGGDAIMRRVALENSGGFDDSLVAGEEPDLCARLRSDGWIIAHVDHAMTGHDLDIHSFRQYWRRAFRAGYAFQEVYTRRAGTTAPLWHAEVRHNLGRAMAMLMLAAAILFCSFGPFYWALVIPITLFAILVARSAWKARWKSDDRTALILYAIHSHFQQIPIFCGQLCCLSDRRSSRKRGLIEYKTS